MEKFKTAYYLSHDADVYFNPDCAVLAVNDASVATAAVQASTERLRGSGKA